MRLKPSVTLSLILVLTGFILVSLEDESMPGENKNSVVSNNSSERHAKYSVKPASQRSNSNLEENNPTTTKIDYLPEDRYYGGELIRKDSVPVYENQNYIISSDDRIERHRITDEDKGFSSEPEFRKLEDEPTNISGDRVQRFGSVHVKPRIEITDVKHPDRVDQHENTKVCVETKSTQPPDIQIIDDKEAVLDYDENSSGEDCFSIHDDELGEHQYTVIASVEDYEDTEKFSLSVKEPNIVSETDETSEGFFRENMAYILLAAFLLAALGFIGRKAT